jgi:hypothetical protein
MTLVHKEQSAVTKLLRKDSVDTSINLNHGPLKLPSSMPRSNNEKAQRITKQENIILHHLTMKYEPITIIINIHSRAIIIKILI